MSLDRIRLFVRQRRKAAGLSQPELALRAEVSLRLLRDLEQGRDRGIRADKLNQILALFGHELAPAPIPRKTTEAEDAQ